MDIFVAEAARRLGDDDVFGKVDALIDWGPISGILKAGMGRSGLGPQGYGALTLFKCLLLGGWHGLSDPKLERALKVRLDFMLFCGLDLHGPTPDYSTLCRFRNGLVGASVYDALLEEICRQLEAHGLKMREAEAAIIDATLIESAARPRQFIEHPPLDREEDEEAPDTTVTYSADCDARWVKKGRKSTLGDKGFARCDESVYIDKVHVPPANDAESPQFETMIDGAKAQRILADKAYASKANRERLKGKHRDGIMRKAARNRPLRKSEKRFNKIITRTRYRVEQSFGTMKRLFGLHRARYFGIDKTHAQMSMAAIAANLTKATNKIKIA